MEQRLIELRRPPVSINGPSGVIDGVIPLGGVLGQLLGQSTAEQKSRLEEATKSAHDLSGLVRKKRQTQSDYAEAKKPSTPGGNGKRAIESLSPGPDPDRVGKKPKLEVSLLDP